MKVKVKAPFFDERGIHKVGEVVDVKDFNPLYHELVLDEKKVKEEKVETADKKEPKKTTRKKG